MHTVYENKNVGRTEKYGHGRAYGKRATLLVIDGEFRPILQRVGVSFHNTVDLACSLLPIPVHSFYEIEWNGRNIGNATFTKKGENYVFI